MTIRFLCLVGVLTSFLAGCASTSTLPLSAYYGEIAGEQHPVLAVDPRDLSIRNLRQIVSYPSEYSPGTVVVDTSNRFLYLVQEGETALRYGIGVGRSGMEFSGTAVIGHKNEWPSWTPTPAMLAREPERYGPFASGVPGGPLNPMGARALYLFKNGKDTLFRIHGTTEPWSIGMASSSGCIRMINQDVIDLYDRVEPGAEVVVI